MKKTTNPSRHLLTFLSLFSLTFYLILPNQTFSKRNTDNENLSPVKQTINSPGSDKSFGNIPVYFEENQGQFDKRVRYFARGTNGYSLFLTATEAVYVLAEHSQKSGVLGDKSEIISDESGVLSDKSKDIPAELTQDSRLPTQDSAKAVSVFMRLAGANEDSGSKGLEQMPHKTSYFRGNDESKWRTGIPNFRQIQMHDVYPGIDIVWHGRANGEVQYDFIVRPNADPNRIAWEIEGAESVETDEKGDLLIKTKFETIRQRKPFTYQETNGFKQEIESKFKLQATPQTVRVGFEIGNYDRQKTLTIDPSVSLSRLAFSTFLGGDSFDEGQAVTVDRAGNVFVAGSTFSPAFPTVPGTLDGSHNGNTDCFVTKLNSSGSALVYSTFLGGRLDDFANGLAVDSSGNAFLTGYAWDQAVAFPTTTGAFDETHNGRVDAFVAKLNAAGTALVYSTFLGGALDDAGQDIAVDGSGNAYVVGTTAFGTPGFPTTAGAFDSTHNGVLDVFVTKLNPTGTALVYSTFLGGSSSDEGNSIAVDASGNAFVTGQTRDDITDYPTTGGAFDTTHNGVRDVFVTKLNTNGSALVYSTYLGGSGDDLGKAIAVDASGHAFVTGQSIDGAVNFPATSGAFDQTPNGISDAYVAKLNPTGTALVYSTFLGGDSEDAGNDIAIDASGEAVIAGDTRDSLSDNLPVTSTAFDGTHNGGFDAFVTRLNAAGSALSYSTFIGGNRGDYGNGIAIDLVGNVYITGKSADNPSASDDYPTTAGAFSTVHSGNEDAFVSKFGSSFNSPTDTDFDLDGDGKTDIGIWRPGPGEWWYLRSSDGRNSAFQFGRSSDKPVPADFTGDGRTDIAFWRNGEFFVLRSEDSSFYAFPFGTNGDIPAPGDFDGDGRADPTVFRPSNATWYYIRSSDGGGAVIQFGLDGDIPIARDYDGDGRSDPAVYRPSTAEWYLQRSTEGFIGYQFGAPGNSTPVPADYTGDGRADIAFYKPSDSEWFVLRSEDISFYAFPFGSFGDRPVPGDYDGDSRADPAVFRPSTGTWFLQQTTDGFEAVQFGNAGDMPIPAAYLP